MRRPTREQKTEAARHAASQGRADAIAHRPHDEAQAALDAENRRGALAIDAAARRKRHRQGFLDVRIEYPSRGATYNRPVFGVYEYSTYERSSVLAGQMKRVFLDSFDPFEEAREQDPHADLTGCNYAPPYLGHLPADDDDAEREDAIGREEARIEDGQSRWSEGR